MSLFDNDERGGELGGGGACMEGTTTILESDSEFEFELGVGWKGKEHGV